MLTKKDLNASLEKVLKAWEEKREETQRRYNAGLLSADTYREDMQAYHGAVSALKELCWEMKAYRE